MFTPSEPGSADAAFLKMNDPDVPAIQARIQAGYVVRTRADGDTVQSRTNDTTQRDAALASGATWVSTDYPVPDLAFSPYQVTIPGGSPARCNPINAPTICRSDGLEQLR
jgi:hypothetical protein